MKRAAGILILVIAIATTFVLGSATVLSHPVQRRIGPPPADLGVTDVAFPSESGAIVHGWLCDVPHAKAVVLLLPGVRANRLAMVDRARFLRRAGYSSLLIDLQATGETRGSHITFGWLERYDVLAAVAFLRRTRPLTPIAIIGQSLGGAAALLATPPLRADAIVVEQVYPTIERATANRLHHYFGPAGTLGEPLLLGQLKPRLGVSENDLRPIDHIDAVRCPIFVIGGVDDTSTTPDETGQLYRRAHSPKQLWLVPGAAHVDLYAAAREKYAQRIIGFLNGCF